MRVEAYTNIGLLRNHRCDSSRMAVACVGQHQFTGLKAEMSNRSAEPLPWVGVSAK
jgi:hypothetical protein